MNEPEKPAVAPASPPIERPAFVFGPQKIRVRASPAFHIVIDGVFGLETNRRIFEHLLELQPSFQEATVGEERRVDRSYRNNLTCYPDVLFHSASIPQDWASRARFRASRSPLLGAIDVLMQSPEMGELLETGPFPLCKFREMNRWETQVSRYGNEGAKYEWHLDRLHGDRRLITVVYYLFREPRRFTGGELELTSALGVQGRLRTNGSVVRIRPRNDRAVLFPSRTLHRVRPTRSPAEFAAGRFSVNVWAGREWPFDAHSTL